MNLRIESAAIDSLMVRLFDEIDEANMPWLMAAAAKLRQAFGVQLIDLVPSYTTLLLHYDLHALSEASAIALIQRSLHNLQPLANETGTLHAIPVWYHQSVGPELTSIAQRAGLSPEQVIEQHCSRDYPVFTLGFAPGFAYMGLVDEALASARLATPRTPAPREVES